MNLLQSLVSKIQSLEQLGTDTAKAVNRSTPWGQANQTNYNAAHAPAAPQPTLGQLAGNGAAPTSQRMTPVQPNIQGVQNPGDTPLQRGGYVSHLMPQQPYDQTQLQVGVPMYPLQQRVNPTYGQLPQLDKPLLQHLSELQ